MLITQNAYGATLKFQLASLHPGRKLVSRSSASKPQSKIASCDVDSEIYHHFLEGKSETSFFCGAYAADLGYAESPLRGKQKRQKP